MARREKNKCEQERIPS